jgi:hypothetical protein
VKIISAAIAATLLVPAVASADDVIITPAPRPSRTVIVDDPYNAPMLASGLTVFALSYGTSVAFALSADDNEPNHHLFVPVVGPWLALADRPDCNVRDTRCDNETAAKVFLALGDRQPRVAVVAPRGRVRRQQEGPVQPDRRRPVRVARVRAQRALLIG